MEVHKASFKNVIFKKRYSVMDPTNPTLCVDGVFWSNVITLWCTFLMKTLEQYACSQKALWRYEGSPLPLSISSIHIDTSTILCKYDQPTVTSECVMINVTVTNCQPHLTWHHKANSAIRNLRRFVN